MLSAVEHVSTPDCDHRGARAPHLGPQSQQECLQIHDLRLPGGIGDHCGPLRPTGRQHGVFRGPHAGDGEIDLTARHMPAG